VLHDDPDLGVLAAELHAEQLRVEQELVGAIFAWPWHTAARERLGPFHAAGFAGDQLSDDIAAVLVSIAETMPDWSLLTVLDVGCVAMERTGQPVARVAALAEMMPGPCEIAPLSRRLRSLIDRQHQALEAFDHARRLLLGQAEPQQQQQRQPRRRRIVIRSNGAAA
jgi:hypothetical protein